MDEYGLEEVENKVGRTPYSPRSMLKLIVYAKINHVTSSEVIEDLAFYHDVYKYVCDYIQPLATLNKDKTILNTEKMTNIHNILMKEEKNRINI